MGGFLRGRSPRIEGRSPEEEFLRGRSPRIAGRSIGEGFIFSEGEAQGSWGEAPRKRFSEGEGSPRGAKLRGSVSPRAKVGSEEVRSPLTGLEDSTKAAIDAAMLHAGLL